MHPFAEVNDGRLYDLLEAGGEQARDSVRLLTRLVEEGGQDPRALAPPAEAGARIADELRTRLLHTVFTSLPKAELETLLSALAAVPVVALRFAERWGLVTDRVRTAKFTPALGWIEELTELVLDALRQLRGFESLERIKELYWRLERVAERAEASIQETVTGPCQRCADPLEVMALTDLGDRLVEILERCREAGRLMNRWSLQIL